MAEDRAPEAALWDEILVASRILEYELWNRIHARELGESHGEAARLLVGSVALLELAPAVLARALEPFPTPVRAWDALHLASIDFLRERGHEVALATYERRLAGAAEAVGIRLHSVH